ncbi:uncharacterized protein EAE98_009971 [Botrytis deweyae]|uniref:BTB domain-containing protein n=1 Tax=Botrytis deweyae TaxID=2478750 RepID=A0ABQ7IA05_9HELO|nr:uncharacterized protein EAE98_009971 [Botrytis deweyae]KAF7917943.1 hypothetical protein EAE98_009971 [Botrytis deweyae]KAF7919789.1 hypothetical protein EAE99_008334 [Botrytis elliptica]
MFEVTFSNTVITIVTPAEMLAQYSPFFEDANNCEWQPDGTNKIFLKIGAPEKFVMLVSWLYIGEPSQGIELCKP